MAHVMVETLDDWKEYESEMNLRTARRLGESGAHRVLSHDKRTVYLVSGAVWRHIQLPAADPTVGKYTVVRV